MNHQTAITLLRASNLLGMNIKTPHKAEPMAAGVDGDDICDGGSGYDNRYRISVTDAMIKANLPTEKGWFMYNSMWSNRKDRELAALLTGGTIHKVGWRLNPSHPMDTHGCYVLVLP